MAGNLDNGKNSDGDAKTTRRCDNPVARLQWGNGTGFADDRIVVAP
ncbi:MAG: hypothetical protein P1V20_20385 [Verrucomicrobiales bacterium]|nr:hypothetical protein [Verrucomicrobiales bacterium]